MKAIEDALRTFPADELIVVTLPDEDAAWLEKEARKLPSSASLSQSHTLSSSETPSETKLDGAYGYLEKRPRLKKPRMANTTMTMMMIQRIDTWSLRRGFADSRFPVGSSLQHGRA
jgi:hypothetical protein